MQTLISLITLAMLGFGGLYVWKEYPQVRQFVFSQIPSESLVTLEACYNCEQLMEKHKKQLLPNSRYSYLEPTLEWHPFLLMKVKYSASDSQTGEGQLLWSLEDGEMILDINDWSKTHGYSDCLNVNADKNDFKIVHFLFKKNGACDRNQLFRELRADPNQIDEWIDQCRRKQLVVVSGNNIRLHLSEPKFATIPITKIQKPLVHKNRTHALTINNQFSPSQITEMTQIAFGNEFAIRSAEQVFLPVFVIPIQNPDGSIRNSRWNAITGNEM